MSRASKQQKKIISIVSKFSARWRWTKRLTSHHPLGWPRHRQEAYGVALRALAKIIPQLTMFTCFFLPLYPSIEMPSSLPPSIDTFLPSHLIMLKEHWLFYGLAVVSDLGRFQLSLSRSLFSGTALSHFASMAYHQQHARGFNNKQWSIREILPGIRWDTHYPNQ